MIIWLLVLLVLGQVAVSVGFAIAGAIVASERLWSKLEPVILDLAEVAGMPRQQYYEHRALVPPVVFPPLRLARIFVFLGSIVEALAIALLIGWWA